MSKHSHKKHRNIEQEEVTQNSPINFDNISQMLNNIDQDQIKTLMNSLNINPEIMQQNSNTGESNEPEAQDTNMNANRNSTIDSDDPGIKLLNAIRPLMAQDKIQILDRILEIYNSGAFDNIK